MKKGDSQGGRRQRLPSLPDGLPAGEARGVPVSIDFEGRPVHAFAGQPVAVALWAAGTRVLARSPKFHRPRGPFCFAGHCGSCAMRIDGEPNRPSCMAMAKAELRCERQNAFPDAELDLLRAADWLFPQGMDHHHLMTGTRIGNKLFVTLVRQMGGAGTLPDSPDLKRAGVRSRVVDVCVVGAGPAGLVAATAIADRGARVVLLDQQSRPGGSLLAEPDGAARADALLTAARRAGVEVWSEATAIGFYPEDDIDMAGAAQARGLLPGVLAVYAPDGLFKVGARRFVHATGSYDQNLPFAHNDRPGVLSARACGRLAFRWGVVPARRLYVVEDDDAPGPLDHTTRLCDALVRLGVTVERVPLSRAQTLPAPRATSAIAVAARPAPAFELARQQGAAVGFDPSAGGFRVHAAGDGVTAAPQVYAAGDCTGYVGPDAAEEAGARVGAAVAAAL